MAEGTRITPNDLELSSQFAKYEARTLKEAREALERDFINRALMKNRGNVSKAAEDLGISRPSLYELMEKLGIEKEAKEQK